MARKTAKFKLEKETPGALRYKEIDPRTDEFFPFPNSPGCMIGTIYLRRDQLNNKTPKEISVHVDWEE